MVRVTSARPSGARPAVPAKMTSSILPLRSAFAPCSPSTQDMASTTLDLPEPFGPTTHVMPGSKRSVVADAKDLKPFTVRVFRCTRSAPRVAPLDDLPFDHSAPERPFRTPRGGETEGTDVTAKPCWARLVDTRWTGCGACAQVPGDNVAGTGRACGEPRNA